MEKPEPALTKTPGQVQSLPPENGLQATNGPGNQTPRSTGFVAQIDPVKSEAILREHALNTIISPSYPQAKNFKSLTPPTIPMIPIGQVLQTPPDRTEVQLPKIPGSDGQAQPGGRKAAPEFYSGSDGQAQPGGRKAAPEFYSGSASIPQVTQPPPMRDVFSMYPDARGFMSQDYIKRGPTPSGSNQSFLVTNPEVLYRGPEWTSQAQQYMQQSMYQQPPYSQQPQQPQYQQTQYPQAQYSQAQQPQYQQTQQAQQPQYQQAQQPQYQQAQQPQQPQYQQVPSQAQYQQVPPQPQGFEAPPLVNSDASDPVQNAKIRADYRVKFGILREAYPKMNIPEPREDQSIPEIIALYKGYVKRIHIDSSVEQNSTYLVIMWLLIEVAGTRYFKFPMKGYFQNQFKYMGKYQMLLIELGERNFSAGFGEGWPVEARLLLMALFNGLIFVMVKMLTDKMSLDPKYTEEIAEQVNNFLTKGGEQKKDALRMAEEATSDNPPIPQPQPADPLGGFGNLLAPFLGMFTGGSESSAKTEPKAEKKQPSSFGARTRKAGVDPAQTAKGE
jgi:hypothetical protein